MITKPFLFVVARGRCTPCIKPEISGFVSRFYQTGKPTAAICHGTCVLLDAKLPDGKFLVEGKRWTGFANSEEIMRMRM